MAKVFFFGNPYHGHTMPTLAVVAELVQRGEQVVYYNTRNFEGVIRAAGAEFRAYPDLGPLPSLEAIVDLAQWSLWSTNLILRDELSRIVQSPPDYIISDVASFWGLCLARKLDIPFLISNPMFVMNKQSLILARKVMPPRKWRRKSLAGLVVGLVKGLGTAGRLCWTYRLRVADLLPSPTHDVHIVYMSKLLHPSGDRLGANFLFVGAPSVERPETADFDFSQLGSQPLVFVSMGTFLVANPTLIRRLFTVLGRLNVQVLMTLDPETHADLISDAPPNITFVKHAPQLATLQKASLFITHGGVGSAVEALSFGVPMIVLPEAFDHFLMANQVTQEGAGLMFGETPSVDELVDALRRVISDSRFADNAKRLGRSLSAAGGARRAADTILAWASASSCSGGPGTGS